MRIYYISISICLLSTTKTLRKSPWNNTIKLLPNAKLVRTKQRRWNPKYIAMVKEELEKLSEAKFIRPMETTEWVSLMVLALKKNGKLRVCINYKALNKGAKKDQYPLPFCEEKFGRSNGAQDVHIQRWVQGLRSSENCSKGLIEHHIHHTMGNILLHNNALWFVQCSKDISMFNEPCLWTILMPFLKIFH